MCVGVVVVVDVDRCSPKPLRGEGKSAPKKLKIVKNACSGKSTMKFETTVKLK